MASSTPEEIPRTKAVKIRTKTKRPRLSLANLAADNPTIAQSTESLEEPRKPNEKIPTFFIWSIFNLLFLPFGIACCFFSYKVRQLKIENHLNKAAKWSKRTFVINIITTLLMIGVIITIVMLRNDLHQNSSSDVNQTLTTGAFIAWQPGR